MNLLVKDERRFQLLESRLGNNPNPNGDNNNNNVQVTVEQGFSPPLGIKSGGNHENMKSPEVTETTSVSTEKGNFTNSGSSNYSSTIPIPPGNTSSGKVNDQQSMKVVEAEKEGNSNLNTKRNAEDGLEGGVSEEDSNKIEIVMIDDSSSSNQPKSKKQKNELDNASPSNQQQQQGNSNK